MQPGPVTHQMAWDPYADKYKCCCNSCHVKTGAMVIGILSIVGGVINFINGMVGASGGAGSAVAGTVVSAILSIGLGALMVYGLNKERAGFVLPYLVLQGIALGLMCVMAVAVLILALAAHDSFVDAIHGYSPQLDYKQINDSFTAIVAILMVFLVLSIALYVWFFLVVLHAYRFLKDQAHFGVLPTAYPPQAYAPRGPQGYAVQAPPAYGQPAAYDNHTYAQK